jgi:ABC-2 type transport system ATP-binding protein
MEPAILVQDLHKCYGDREAVKGLSLQIEPGQIYGLLGPNGAGKTTTIRCICTLTQPDRGVVKVCGQENARSIRACLGYVAQEVALDKVLTGKELLELQAALYHIPRKQIRDRVHSVLELVQLSEYANEKTGNYSGGLKKRLDLAAGLLHQPQVLVLDEPTVGLDIQTRLIVWDFLRQLKANGITILITSHYLEEIDALADRVAIIDRGQVIAEGTPTQLKSEVGGDRLTIKIKEFTERSQAEQTLALLKDLPFVRSSSINPTQGNALNLVITPDPDAISKVQSVCDSEAISLFSLTQSRPSLDDVFLTATGQTIQDIEIAQAEAEAAMGKKKKKK